MKIVIFAAGTGGHIFPALSIAEEFEKDNVIFFASNRELEKQIYQKTDYKVIHLNISGFRGKNILEKLIWPISFIFNLFKVAYVFISFNPKKVLLMGGYISSLGLVAGKMFLKSIYLHEQNSILGTSNSFAKNFVKKIFTSFELGLRNELNFGNPVRKDIRESNYFDNLNKENVLVIGGSQGSKFFNENLPQILGDSNISEKIIFQKGDHQINSTFSKIEFVDFIDNISEVFAKTKFVICRSGASTVAELQSYGMPALFFPLPDSIDDHQKHNAAFAAKDGGAIVFNEREFNKEEFLAELNRFNASDLRELSKKIKKGIHSDAAKKIADEIKQN
tara:strand:- start:824 stop:1825 length:1002 start_codon:yes stop_codon:yes gene_type:complete